MMLIQKIRDSFYTKVMVILMIMSFFGDLIYPNMANALTGGNVDINQVSFEPASTSEMVNLATGDFTYNIPLLDVGGYPINLSYHAGVSMEQEASMVGLGWTVNVGALNRTKRGLPDDFKGDQIKTTMNLRPASVTGGSVGIGGELLGLNVNGKKKEGIGISFGANVGVTQNNYIGTGVDLSSSAGLLIGSENSNAKLNIGVGLESSSQNGLTISPSANLLLSPDGSNISKLGFNLGIGFSTNSVSGLSGISTSAGMSLDGAIGYAMNNLTSGSSTYSLGTRSYTPSIAFEKTIKTRNFDYDGGIPIGPFYAHLRGGFFKSLTCLNNNEELANAYGYLYEDDKQLRENYLLDFNRSGAVIPNDQVKYLPVTNHTFDIFNATGQGVIASFRPHRNDVLTVSEVDRESEIGGYGISGEVGGSPSGAKFGLNFNRTTGKIFSGDWKYKNELRKVLRKKDADSEPLYEEFYFKKLDNRATINDSWYNGLAKAKPLFQKIELSGITMKGTTEMISNSGGSITMNGSNHYQSERVKRNTNIEYLTGKEASHYALEKKIKSYDFNDYTLSSSGDYHYTELNRMGSLSTEPKAHHLSEMSVLNSDGSTYVYGIPVVNQKTYEVTFNVSNKYPDGIGLGLNNVDHETGLVEYNQGTPGNFLDNSLDNRRGANNLYLKKEIPATANSYLLTASLSSNYIDRTGDGPTIDDYGSYTKFNYSKLSAPTKWRIPVGESTAAYNPGLRADEYDDMGSYVYGERDQWYIHSIETKNYVAEFIYGERHDGYGVKDEDGGFDFSEDNPSKRLIEIRLYTRLGKLNNEAPLKTIHFEYDYSLCQNVPNNDGGSTSGEIGVAPVNLKGKLTLKAVYFTYQSSNRGKLHKYKFDYNPTNPNYKFGQANRWGTYSAASANSSLNHTGEMNNLDWPYVNQDKTVEDANVAAWSLKTIHLPSGSDIEIELESDDYSYLQNRRPSKMFKIEGFSLTNSSNLPNSTSLGVASAAQNYMHVKLDEPLTGSDPVADFKTNYLGALEEIYFKCLVRVTGKPDDPTNGGAGHKYEYVSGYAEIDRSDITVNGDIAILKLKAVGVHDEEAVVLNDGVNPIQKASWQMVRKYLTNVVVYPRSVDIFKADKDAVTPYGYNCDWDSGEAPDVDKDSPKPSEDTKNEGRLLRNIYNIGVAQAKNLLSFGGFNTMMQKLRYCEQIVPEKSFVRLYQGISQKKLGGGHRVKQITVNDNWSDVISNENSSTYGTQYIYETRESGQWISSGVASYEPISAGSDENSFREPVHYTIDVKFRVNDGEFHEKPFGESIFASPSVIYSKVSVKNIDYAGLINENTGSTEYQFYTAKDFPSLDVSKSKHTEVDKQQLKPAESALNTLKSFFTGLNYRYLSMSQGYSVYLNDMHGKFKSKIVYGAAITGIEKPVLYSLKHNYYTESNGELLNNDLMVVNDRGVVSQKTLGQEMDMVVDNTHSGSFHSSIDASFDLDINGPVPIPTAWVRPAIQDNKYYSSVTTKVIYNKGILKNVELMDKGRVKRTTNLLFDENTGTPILTKIESESAENTSKSTKFYQYDFPAYWAYTGMGHAADNWGAEFIDLETDANGMLTISDPNDFFSSGDELMIEGPANPNNERFWILENEVISGQLAIIDEYGAILSNLAAPNKVKIIKSGKKNLLGSTFQSITTSSENDMVVSAGMNTPFNGSIPSDVINASAVQYTEKAKHSIGIDPTGDNCGVYDGDQVNPYLKGLLGNWNLLSTWVYDDERNQANQRVREEGKYTNFYRTWRLYSNGWKFSVGDLVAYWTNTANATLYNEEGYNLESNDVLGIYSSILLGYNQSLKTAEAVNARYGEIAFDGFEDRAYQNFDDDCKAPFFRFIPVQSGQSEQISNTEAHTGDYSLKLSANQTLQAASKREGTIPSVMSDHAIPFIMNNKDVINGHTYLVDLDKKQYLFSAWVKEEKTGNGIVNYDGAQITVPTNATKISETRSNIIDGWQRIEVIFEFTGGSQPGIETLSISAGTNPVYFDDIRIQPFNSEMVSYVINPETLRLDATLDSRNFATIYQYDEEGSLIRIIQETEKGKVTVQENRAGIKN